MPKKNIKKLEDEFYQKQIAFEERGKKVNQLLGERKTIIKFYDHVNLAIQQANYIQEHAKTTITAFTHQTAYEGEKLAKVFDEKIEASESSYKQRIRDSEKNYIAILGIFATIVLSFTGGLVFSTSVFSNIHNVSMYHSVCIALIIGIVIVNILYFMFYCIERCSGKKTHMWGGIAWIVVNILLIGLLACDYFAWNNGMIEKRDACVANIIQDHIRDSNQQSTSPMVLQKEIQSIFDTTAPIPSQ